MKIDKRRFSKKIAHALRHAPELYGLDLDDAGWVSVDDLIEGVRQHRRWREVTLADIEAVLAMPGKKRYEMANGRIRALYGHSTSTKIVKTPVEPPEILYHGTKPETAVLILQTGLKPMRRQYVHLSLDVETAVIVGQRRAKNPTVLHVQAKKAFQAGIQFYQERDLIWLADFVPPEFVVKP